MTALYTTPKNSVVGIEEPENYIHPSALSCLVEHLKEARKHIQVLVTTHSPMFLDFLDEPKTVRIVRRDTVAGTLVSSDDAEGVRNALDASGFGLDSYYETKGFGA